MIFDAIDFPIEGPLAEPLLIIEWIIFFLYFELALAFWVKKIRNKNRIKNLQERGYGWVFFGFSLMLFSFIISDHYVESGFLRLVFLNVGYIILMISALFFIYTMEKYKIFIKKFLFSIIFMVYSEIFIIVLIFQINYTQFFSFFFWPIFIIFFIFYSKALGSIFKLNPILGQYKFKYIKLVLGILLLIFGFGLTTDFIITNFGLEARLIGDLLQIIALIFLYLFFSSIPSFSEYDWQKKINNLFIMHKSGLLIYQKSFSLDEKLSSKSSISGVITSLKMMLETISKEEVTSFIEKKGKVVIIQPGKYVNGALICDEKLESLQILLSNFINKVEETYSNVLKNWDGDLKVFRPVENIAKEVFY